MKSIGRIKETFREISPDKNVSKKVVETLATEREKIIRKDPKIIENITINVQKNEILSQIKKQSKKLDKLNKEVMDRVDEAAKSGDIIIQEAKKRAEFLIQDADRKRGVADTLLQKAVNLEKVIDKKQLDVKELQEKVLDESREVAKRKLEVGNRLETIAGQEILAQKDLKEAVDMLSLISGLFIVALEKAVSVEKIEVKALDLYYKREAEIGKIYAEVQRLQAVVDSANEYNENRSKELDKKELLIKDRHETLNRSIKEVERKLKNYDKIQR